MTSIENLRSALVAVKPGAVACANKNMFRQINFKNLEIMKQILISFSFRLMGPVIMLLTTPQLLSTLGNVEYGVWSLLITTISWLTICDFGISNQIRNESKILIVQDNKESIR